MTADQMKLAVTKLLAKSNFTALDEFTIPNGRRFDLIALNPHGKVIGVEIKVSEADMRGDWKWPEYIEWCDLFYLAVAPKVPLTHRWKEAGLITINKNEACITHHPLVRNMSTGRRAYVMMEYARVSMFRLQALTKEIRNADTRPL